MSDREPTSMEERARRLLQESAEQLDGATRSRLTQARNAAVEAVNQRQRSPWYWLMPASGAAAAAVLAVLLMSNPVHEQIDGTVALEPVDELDILTAEDSLEFYRDVEFYAWLDSVLEAEPAPESDV